MTQQVSKPERRVKRIAAPPQPRGLTTKAWLSRRCADALGLLFTTLPLPFGYWVADRIGDLFYRFSPGYRGNIIDNLTHILGPGVDLDQQRRLARQAFHNSARNFYDLTRLRYLSLPQIARQVVVLGDRATIDRAYAQGKGIIFVTAHTGAFDFAGQMLIHFGYPSALVTVRTVSEFIHHAVTYLRARHGYILEEATPGGLRRLLRRLRQGGTIGLAIDRDFLRNGVPVTFFGAETTLPVGAVRLARESGAPLLPVICRRHRVHQTMVIEEPIVLQRTGDLEADLRCGMEALVAMLERHIGAAPEQWSMGQRVWPTTPPPPIAVFPVGSPLEGRVLGGEASSRAADPPPPRP